MVPQNNSNGWAAACHLASFAGVMIPFGNILGPLIVWATKKGTSSFVDEQGKESLNFQISWTVYEIVIWVVAGAVFIPTALFEGDGMGGVGMAFAGLIPLIGLWGLMMLLKCILVIIASVNAAQGKSFSYPFIFRLVK